MNENMNKKIFQQSFQNMINMITEVFLTVVAFCVATRKYCRRKGHLVIWFGQSFVLELICSNH